MEEEALHSADTQDSPRAIESLEMEAGENHPLEIPLEEDVDPNKKDSIQSQQEEIPTPVESIQSEVDELKSQLEQAKETIRHQNNLLTEKTNEVSALQQQISSVHMDELIQLYQIQRRENEYMREEMERVRTLLSDKKQSDSDIHQFQEDASKLITSITSLVEESHQSSSILNQNYALLQDQFQTYQSTTEHLIGDVQKRMQEQFATTQEKESELSNLKNQHDAIVSENDFLKNKISLLNAHMKQKERELTSLKNKANALEIAYNSYVAIETEKMEKMHQQVNDLNQQLKKAEEAVNKSMKYKLLAQSMIQQAANTSVTDSANLEEQVLQLKKEKEMLLLNIQHITNELEEQIPIYQHQQNCYLNLNQNYNQLLILWNTFIGSTENTANQTESTSLLYQEIQRQKHENEGLRKQIESLETLLLQFRQLLIQRGSPDIPEIESILASYQKRILELEEANQQYAQDQKVLMEDGQTLRDNIQLLETNQLLHEERFQHYAKKVENLHKELEEAQSQLNTTFHQLDETKLAQLTLLGNYLRLAHSIKQREIGTIHHAIHDHVETTLKQYTALIEEMNQTIANQKPISLVIEPSSCQSQIPDEELFGGICLSEKIKNLENQKKELEDTMQEMEEEANDMNRSIEMYERKNQQLEHENAVLKQSLQFEKQNKQKQLELVSLGNPFDFTQYSLNAETVAIQSHNISLKNQLEVVKQEKKALETSLSQIQHVVDSIHQEDAIWKEMCETIQNTAFTAEKRALLAQLTIAKISEATLTSKLHSEVLNKRQERISVLEFADQKQPSQIKEVQPSTALRQSISLLEQSVNLLQNEKALLAKNVTDLENQVQESEKRIELLQQELKGKTDLLNQKCEVSPIVSEKRENSDECVSIPEKIQKMEEENSI